MRRTTIESLNELIELALEYTLDGIGSEKSLHSVMSTIIMMGSSYGGDDFERPADEQELPALLDEETIILGLWVSPYTGETSNVIKAARREILAGIIEGTPLVQLAKTVVLRAALWGRENVKRQAELREIDRLMS